MAKKPLSEMLGGVTRFGRLTVLREVTQDGKHRKVECLCDCGSTSTPYVFCLKSGQTRSCGCLGREKSVMIARAMGLRNRREQSHASERKSWRAAIRRCENPNDQAFADYGARGIKVCDSWRDDFDAFMRDMGKRPPGGTLERIDNDRGYEPGNCQWRTVNAQNRNRRNTVLVEWRGRQVPLAKLTGLASRDYGNVWRRIFILGWDVEKALATPIRSKRRAPK